MQLLYNVRCTKCFRAFKYTTTVQRQVKLFKTTQHTILNVIVKQQQLFPRFYKRNMNIVDIGIMIIRKTT